MSREVNLREEYATKYTTSPSGVLQEVERNTYLKTLAPQMSAGALQGRFLSLLSKLVQAETILEVGTFTAYGSLCLAEGLVENGKLHTIESNKELAYMIEDAVAQADLQDKIIVHYGDALKILSTLDENYDLVYLDASKDQYLQYYQIIFERVRRGGLIIADNVLWDNKVISEARSDEALELHRFNEFVLADTRVENILLPIRDGLMVCRKI